MSRIEQLTAMHEADPSDPFLSYGIAMEHGKAEAFEQAIEWLDRTLAIDEAYCYAYYQKARMLGELGEDARARGILAKGMAAARAAGDEHAESEMSELLATLD
ncbi:MAG: hypothetical protein CMJ18_23305 [Phycisphaeraceae bacterium]|nr:hypothetical protein [Phycisphaeraceae bacterium]